MQRDFAVTVRWRAFPLHPETPEEGRSLHELFRTSPDKISAMMARLQAQASTLGLPFGARTMTYNSRLAQELGLWAEACGRGGRFHKAAFHAYFAEGANLARPSVLLEIARKAGLSEPEAAEVLAERSYRAQVDRDWAEARFQLVDAVPTFLIGRNRLVGAQQYQTLADLLDSCGVGRRAAGAKPQAKKEG